MRNLIVSNDSFEVLKQLSNGVSLADPLPYDQLDQLEKAGLITYRIVGHKDSHDDILGIMPIYEIHINESGKAYIEWREHEYDSVERQIQALNEMNESLKTRVAIAEKDSKSALICSILAILVSIAAIVVPIFCQ